jgi:hypothetical protein
MQFVPHFGEDGGDLLPLRFGEWYPFGEEDLERPGFRAVTHRLFVSYSHQSIGIPLYTQFQSRVP